VQAQACVWEKRIQTFKIQDNFQDNVQAGQECAEVNINTEEHDTPYFHTY
jgi:hypothetical protein